MPNSHVSQQARHVSGLEDVSEQTISLLEVEPVLKARRDARGILAAVLKHGEAFVDDRANWTTPEDADNTAHVSSLPDAAQTSWITAKFTSVDKTS
jgi:hypothetical protein